MKAFAVTDIGKKRQLNQDHLYASEKPVGKLPNIFLVADGMGGHKAGGYASSCAVETILKETERCAQGDAAQILTRAIQRANDVIARKAGEDERFSGMGTTVVAACVEGKELIAANVGDSRLYVVHAGSIEQVTEEAGVSLEDVRWFILHQANYRISESIAKRLKVSMDRIPMNIESYGNTSAATVPVLLDEMNRQGTLKKGDLLVLAGFGGGLTWGATLFTWQMG